MQVKSSLAIIRTRTRNDMRKSTHGVVDFFIKQCSGMLEMRFFRMIMHKPFEEGVYLLFIEKIFQNLKH